MALRGSGKTTLANIIANEMGSTLQVTSGPVLDKPGDLAGLLTNLNAGDVLFIDEIHRLSPIIEEYLYSAMEDYRIDIVLDKGPSARSIQPRTKSVYPDRGHYPERIADFAAEGAFRYPVSSRILRHGCADRYREAFGLHPEYRHRRRCGTGRSRCEAAERPVSPTPCSGGYGISPW